MRLLDPRFKYVPSAKTDISATWRRYGFRPTTDAERRARQRASIEGSASFADDFDLLPRRRQFGLKLIAK
jgi:hypothetical protein